jgi:hypothetical protein
MYNVKLFRIDRMNPPLYDEYTLIKMKKKRPRVPCSLWTGFKDAINYQLPTAVFSRSLGQDTADSVHTEQHHSHC